MEDTLLLNPLTLASSTSSFAMHVQGLQVLREMEGKGVLRALVIHFQTLEISHFFQNKKVVLEEAGEAEEAEDTVSYLVLEKLNLGLIVLEIGGPGEYDQEGGMICPPGRNGRSGHSGIPGKTGRAGRRGMNAADGQPGKEATFGSVMFVVRDSNGNIVEGNGICYNAATQGYFVKGLLDDGIFEPGEEIQVSDLMLFNNGRITLPSGPIVSFPSTSTVSFAQEAVLLPSVPPQSYYTLSQVFNGKIYDIPEPVCEGLTVKNKPILPQILFSKKRALCWCCFFRVES